jgi:hypothetical protein
MAAGPGISGPDFQPGWRPLNQTERLPEGIPNMAGSTSNIMRFTGVQLEVGKVATPFEHRSYGEELAACQRYYQYVERARGSGNRDAGSNVCAFSHNIPDMRVSPSMTRVPVGSPYNWNFVGFSNANKSHVAVLIEIITADAYWYYNDGYIADAEL